MKKSAFFIFAVMYCCILPHFFNCAFASEAPSNNIAFYTHTIGLEPIPNSYQTAKSTFLPDRFDDLGMSGFNSIGNTILILSATQMFTRPTPVLTILYLLVRTMPYARFVRPAPSATNSYLAAPVSMPVEILALPQVVQAPDIMLPFLRDKSAPKFL